MRNKLLIASIIGSIAYIINILLGLILFQPLVNILKHGIISFVIIFIFSFVIIYIIEFLKEENSQQIKKEGGYADGDEQTVAEEDNTDNNNDNQFSPMEPPVVEYEEKKES